MAATSAAFFMRDRKLLWANEMVAHSSQAHRFFTEVNREAEHIARQTCRIQYHAFHANRYTLSVVHQLGLRAGHYRPLK